MLCYVETFFCFYSSIVSCILYLLVFSSKYAYLRGCPGNRGSVFFCTLLALSFVPISGVVICRVGKNEFC